MGQGVQLFKQDPLNATHRGKFYFARNFMDATLAAKRKGIPRFNVVWLDRPQYIDDMQVAPKSSVTIFIPTGRNDLAALAMNMDFKDGEEDATKPQARKP